MLERDGDAKSVKKINPKDEEGCSIDFALMSVFYFLSCFICLTLEYTCLKEMAFQLYK